LWIEYENLSACGLATVILSASLALRNGDYSVWKVIVDMSKRDLSPELKKDFTAIKTANEDGLE
jgi:hypothetical protein